MTASLTLLFDLDGTLVDTDALHLNAWGVLLAEGGPTLTLHDYRTRIMGAPNDAIMALLFPDHPASSHAAPVQRLDAMRSG